MTRTDIHLDVMLRHLGTAHCDPRRHSNITPS
jgi:hypothetical protein